MAVTVGSRLAFEGALCTVRYIGEVQGTKGQWLGVEWDDLTRGKHSGEHQGVKYFQCKSNHPIAGSFVRPTRQADQQLSFLQAANWKYVSELQHISAGQGNASPTTPIEISGKVVEEVGFEKIRKQLAELQELRIVLLDGMRVHGVLASEEASREEYERELEKIARTSPKIVELDLSRNLLRSWREVADICGQLKYIRILKLNGNRFGEIDESVTFSGISELTLDETLMDWKDAATLSHLFPSLTTLSLSGNEFLSIPCPISNTVKELRLEYNGFESLHSIRELRSLSNLERLSLRGNNISKILPTSADEKEINSLIFPPNLRSLDISFNKINTWSFIDALPKVFPGLASLRVSDNPLYDQPPASTRITNLPEYPMTVDEAYMLTLAHISQLQSLNYSKIINQDRNNGELYYLSLIRKELVASPKSAEQRIIASHPRYAELCEIYGEVEIKRPGEGGVAGSGIHSRSLAARLVTFHFYIPSRNDSASAQQSEFKTSIPKSFDVYRIKAIVARHFSLTPLRLKLIWETEEWDPVDEAKAEDDEWDSSDEGDGGDSPVDNSALKHEDGKKLVRREEELVDSTREVGFWFSEEVRAVRVRVEVF
ncbi:hypothetical protein FQN53_000143 [Emmonsiellopsis sp. PD_33]|nr:hypothetical protein FQN53_000143 [Emmonsiellopsis sp. PD_33]KAK2799625.1 hypothetical protein FQN51_006757 [Onygenales sp. PD_10]